MVSMTTRSFTSPLYTKTQSSSFHEVPITYPPDGDRRPHRRICELDMFLVDTDVVVVGGGSADLSCAYEPSKNPNVQVNALLDVLVHGSQYSTCRIPYCMDMKKQRIKVIAFSSKDKQKATYNGNNLGSDKVQTLYRIDELKLSKESLWWYLDLRCYGTAQAVMVISLSDLLQSIPGNSDIASEYVKRTQVIVNELLKDVSENVGFEASYLNKELNLESSFPLLAVNYCPFLLDFDISRGFMPHTDHSVLTLLYENGVPGLEVFHNGKWVVMSGAPNAFLVLNVNNLEIFSNGVYKSKLHRAVVKDECKRITLVNTNGPSLDTVVGPSPRLVDEQDYPAGYLQTYIAGKHAFDIVRLQI
ncbi:2-oxoglutarate (2OG) and Fe(II)-dependent oxygenase superfamily protein [Tanacetum coccineum]